MKYIYDLFFYSHVCVCNINNLNAANNTKKLGKLTAATQNVLICCCEVIKITFFCSRHVGLFFFSFSLSISFLPFFVFYDFVKQKPKIFKDRAADIHRETMKKKRRELEQVSLDAASDLLDTDSNATFAMVCGKKIL